jgi:Siphovirus Gp157
MSNLTLALQHAEKIEQMLIESGGEITPELEFEMKINPATITELVDIKYVSIERIESSIEFFEKKAEEFKNIAASLKNAKKYTQDSIKQYMRESGKDSLQGEDYCFKLSKGKPIVNVMNEASLPLTYFKTKTEKSVDKALIFDDLKKGIPVEGCVLEESYTLRKSINKGGK